ncbi:MAG: DNA polymerase III subunit delta [Alphaproteobacteria bacterium]|nr:DNA polymerase III subunit delta [Alphaproteobacteria bacterium]
MKIAPRQIRAFLSAPDPAVRAVLVYGPDGGLVRERAATLAATVVPDLADPFRIATLTAAELKTDPARLHDEAAAVSMTGGRRVVRVRSDGDTPPPTPFAALLDDATAEALVVIEAGDLPPRAPLRKLFEAAKTGAALPCYSDDGETLEDVISATFSAAGMTVTGDARNFLCEHLGGDRMVTRGELEKIVLYMGGSGEVDLTDVEACIGDSSTHSTESAALAAAEGDFRNLDRALARLNQEGQSPVATLRGAQRHFQRLHLAAALVAEGRSAEQAIGALRPPPFFKVRGRLIHQLRLWTRPRLAHALDVLVDAEAACKRTGMPAEAICGRALLMLANAAQRARRR